jgi:hypothetical protein
MESSLMTELAAVRAQCDSATATGNARKTADWCLGHLPDLYRQFCQTNDIRYGDEIRRLIQGLLMALNDADAGNAITERLRAMHTRLGIPALDFGSRKR